MIKDYPGVVATADTTRVQRDGTIKRVAVIKVDRPTSPLEDGFDPDWFDGLTSEIGTLLKSTIWDSAEVVH